MADQIQPEHERWLTCMTIFTSSLQSCHAEGIRQHICDPGTHYIRKPPLLFAGGRTVMALPHESLGKRKLPVNNTCRASANQLREGCSESTYSTDLPVKNRVLSAY